MAGSAHTSVGNCLLVFCGEWGLVSAKPFWPSKLGDLGASPLSGSHKSWGARCTDKLLPGRSWTLTFIIGVSEGRDGEGSAHSTFRLLEEHNQLPDTSWLETLNPWAATRKVCSQTHTESIREKLITLCFILFPLCWSQGYSHGKYLHFCLKPPVCLMWSWGTHKFWSPLALRAR